METMTNYSQFCWHTCVGTISNEPGVAFQVLISETEADDIAPLLLAEIDKSMEIARQIYIPRYLWRKPGTDGPALSECLKLPASRAVYAVSGKVRFKYPPHI